MKYNVIYLVEGYAFDFCMYCVGIIMDGDVVFLYIAHQVSKEFFKKFFVWNKISRLRVVLILIKVLI